MSMINNTNDLMKTGVDAIKLVLSLIFPRHELKIMPNLLLLDELDTEGNKVSQCIINNDNFEEFREIIKEMFCLSAANGADNYNPADKKAAQIAKKLKERHKKLSQKNNNASKKELGILYRYILILALGNHHTIPELMEYTVYQLFNQFRKFEKKYSYDIWFSAKIAGAEGMKDADNWLLDDQDNANVVQRPKSNKIEY